ncbi:MAG: ATP-binding cassette domain-containing protein [Prevotella sp.]|nr:ATP-binding cassette domain-containing protein [Prevotella sp.]
MIHIQDMTFGYTGRRKPVFSDFSLTLEQGNIYGLLGKNGTGKSTLLYLISGLLRPDRGSVSCDTIAADGAAVPMEASARRPEVLQELFLVPEEFEFPLTTLDGYVAQNAPFYPHFSREVLRRCLHEFELEDTTTLFSLSMGQKKKVLVSFALATGTRFLLMDEPTNGLDIPSKSQFRKVIAQNMTDDRLLIVSTHQVHDVESLLDHILILGDDSQLLLNQSVASLTERYAFTTRPVGEYVGPLYSEPTPQGLAAINGRTPDQPETQLNLELLFNAVTKGALQ